MPNSVETNPPGISELNLRESPDDETQQLLGAMTFQRRDLLLNHLELIPTFTGTDPQFSFARFKGKFEEIARFLQWSAEDQFFAVRQRLAGPAQTVFSNYKDEIASVKDLFAVLGERFETEKDPAALLAEFWAFKQGQATPVKEFLAMARAKVKTLIKKHNLPNETRKEMEEQWLVAMLLKNLLPPIRRAVIARNPEDLQELIEIACLEEKAIKQVGTTTEQDPPAAVFAIGQGDASFNGDRQTKLENLVAKLQESVGLLASQLETLTVATPRQDSPPIRCFKCNQFGHLRNQCPQRDRSERRGSLERGQPFQSRQPSRNLERSPNPGWRNWRGDNFYRSPSRERREGFAMQSSQAHANRNSGRGEMAGGRNFHGQQRRVHFGENSRSQTYARGRGSVRESDRNAYSNLNYYRPH